MEANMRKKQEYCQNHGILHVLGKKIIWMLAISLCVMFISTASNNTAHAQSTGRNIQAKVSLGEGNVWSYQKGNQAPNPKWFNRDYDDTSWHKGPYGFGYGTGKIKTHLGDMTGSY